MMTKKTVLCAFTACILTIGFTKLSSRPEQKTVLAASVAFEDSPPAQENSGELDVLKRDIVELQETLQRLAAEKEALSAEQDQMLQRREDEDTTKQPVEETQTEEQKADFLAHQFELKYSAQGDDPDWSQETEQSIQGLFVEDRFSGTDLVAVDCQTSMCRLELSYESDEARESFLSQAPTTAPLNTEGYFHVAEDRKTTVVYVAREGHSLDS